MFEAFLKLQTRVAWARVLDALLPSIHEVDRNATRIWFHLFPLALADALAQSAEPEELARTLRLKGDYTLRQQVDTSHRFFYGHRYWPQVKASVVKHADSQAPTGGLDLVTVIRGIAREAASSVGVEEALLTGISAVGVMTLQQVGLLTFRADAQSIAPSSARLAMSPAQIIAAREQDDRQGLLGLFRGIKARYAVTFDENRADAHFPLINRQHLTTAAAADTRSYTSGPRPSLDGPIPVQCRSGSCGTCWVGILGGANKLSDVDPLEARRMKEFGYLDSTEAKPPLRLACMAMATGNVTLVIPPWNGSLGKAGLGSD